MQATNFQALLGLPLAAAQECLAQEKIPYEIIAYESPRGPIGPDRRVLRAVYSDGKLQLTVGSFCTEVNGDKIENE